MSRIVSATPGRIRIRDKTLRDGEHARRVTAALSAIDGVSECFANLVAGSVVVRFNPALIDIDTLEAAVDAACDANSRRPPNARPMRRKLNRYAKIGMLGGMAATLAFAASGQKRWHTLAGGVFVSCLGVHLLAHRRHLLR